MAKIKQYAKIIVTVILKFMFMIVANIWWIVLGIGIIAGIVAIAVFVITWVWQWVVPDVFAGAVAQNILPATLTFGQAVKLGLLLSVLGLRTTVTAINSKNSK